MNIVFGCLLFGFSLIANAGTNLELNVDATESSFVVSLAANPTTGYTWSVLEFDKNLLTLTSSQYQKAKNKLIGAGGQMLFTFSLNKGKTYPQRTNMTFKYARSWEPNSATLQKITVNFTGTR